MQWVLFMRNTNGIGIYRSIESNNRHASLSLLLPHNPSCLASLSLLSASLSSPSPDTVGGKSAATIVVPATAGPLVGLRRRIQWVPLFTRPHLSLHNAHKRRRLHLGPDPGTGRVGRRRSEPVTCYVPMLFGLRREVGAWGLRDPMTRNRILFLFFSSDGPDR